MSRLGRHWLACSLLGCLIAVTLWAALAPLSSRARDLPFDIPEGAWARRMAGDRAESLPGVVRLTLGVKDVLLLRNRDSDPQMFGPTVILPGQEYRVPFADVSEHEFAFTARVSGQIRVIVEPHPTPGLERLRWRLAMLAHAIRYYAIVPPT